MEPFYAFLGAIAIAAPLPLRVARHEGPRYATAAARHNEPLRAFRDPSRRVSGSDNFERRRAENLEELAPAHLFADAGEPELDDQAG